MDEEEDANLIRDLEFLTSGQVKALKVKNANLFLQKLLLGIIINDELEEDEESQIDKTVVTDTENDSEHETDSESDGEGNPNLNLPMKSVCQTFHQHYVPKK